MRNKINALLGAAVMFGASALETFNPLPTKQRPSKKPRPMSQADHEALAKADAKRTRKAAIKREKIARRKA